MRPRNTRARTLADPAASRDFVSSSLVALAKIGRDPSILRLLARFLRSPVQETRETAALAMGIAALPEAVPDLLALATDQPPGRALVGRAEVDFRTRSFACYGLGLIGWATKEAAVKERIFTAMRGLLDAGRRSRRDVKVAALNAIRLLRFDTARAGERRLYDAAIDFLRGWASRRGEFAQVRAHALTARSRLAHRAGRVEPELCAEVASLLGRRRRSWIHRAAVLALGLLGDKTVASQLVARLAEGGTVAVRSAVAKALGFIGDKEPLPWDNKIAVDLDYRANVETLTAPGGTGILDIL